MAATAATLKEMECVTDSIFQLLYLNYHSVLKIFSAFWTVLLAWMPVITTLTTLLAIPFLLYLFCRPAAPEKVGTYVVVDPKHRSSSRGRSSHK